MLFKVVKKDALKKRKKEKENSIRNLFSFDDKKEFIFPRVNELFKRFPEKAEVWKNTFSVNDYVGVESKYGEIVLLEHISSKIKWINWNFFKEERKYEVCFNKYEPLDENNNINNFNYKSYIFDKKEKKNIVYLESSKKIGEDDFSIKILWENIHNWNTRSEKISFLFDE